MSRWSSDEEDDSPIVAVPELKGLVIDESIKDHNPETAVIKPNSQRHPRGGPRNAFESRRHGRSNHNHSSREPRSHGNRNRNKDRPMQRNRHGFLEIRNDGDDRSRTTDTRRQESRQHENRDTYRSGHRDNRRGPRENSRRGYRDSRNNGRERNSADNRDRDFRGWKTGGTNSASNSGQRHSSRPDDSNTNRMEQSSRRGENSRTQTFTARPTEAVELPKQEPFCAFCGNIPNGVSQEEFVREFFKDLKIKEVRTPGNKDFCYVDFETQDDLRQALDRNTNFKGCQLKVNLDTARRRPNTRNRAYGGKNGGWSVGRSTERKRLVLKPRTVKKVDGAPPPAATQSRSSIFGNALPRDEKKWAEKEKQRAEKEKQAAVAKAKALEQHEQQQQKKTSGSGQTTKTSTSKYRNSGTAHQKSKNSKPKNKEFSKSSGSGFFTKSRKQRQNFRNSSKASGDDAKKQTKTNTHDKKATTKNVMPQSNSKVSGGRYAMLAMDEDDA